MGGVAKAVTSPITKVFGNGTIGRAVSGVATGGLSEFGQKNPFGVPVNNPFAGTQNTAPLAAAPGGQSPTDMLAQTGGAPVLASVAMGVSPKTALAGFMGVPESGFDDYVSRLNPKDAASLQSTLNTLNAVQSNTDLRNKAVQSVINDFPNITAKIAQDRQASGQEFDQATQGYMKQALDQTAAKFAAGGGLSSGAANDAFAKNGADMAMSKLDYMGQREAASRQQNMAGFTSRLGEVNALRDFQNTMLGQGAQQGFSAAQANLGRIQQGGMANADFTNQRYIADQNSNNQMMGALGSLGGTVLGGMAFGPMGAAAGSKLGGAAASGPQSGYFNANAPKVYNTSYGRTMGGY